MANQDYAVTLQALLSTSSLNGEVQKLQNILKKYPVEINAKLNEADFAKKLKPFAESMAEELNKTFNTNLSGKDVFNALNSGLREARKEAQQLNTVMSNNDVELLRQRYEKFYNANTASHRMFGKQLKASMAELSSGADITKKRYQELSFQLKSIEGQARAAGKLGLTFTDKLKAGISKFTSWFSSVQIFMKGIQEIRKGINLVTELDSALTNINYTMNVTESQLSAIGKSSIEMAKNLKTSTKNVLEAVTLYANAKENADSILKKAETATMLSNVTGMGAGQSAKMLQSVMNQFDLTEKDLTYISDTIQKVSQNMAYDFSSGINEISQGIERSGSVAKTAGLDLAEYSSMLGLVIEKTGLGGDTIGNAFKTIFSRITKASATEGTLNEDISKAEESLRAVGVAVRSSSGEFRDMGEIMADLGNVWNSLSDVQQSNISYQVAGIRQTNILKTLLNYWTDYESLVEEAGDATGTTFENQEKYAKTFKGELTELKATSESFWNNVLNSTVMKGGINLLTTIVSLFERLTGLFGSAGTIGIGAGLYAGLKNIGRPKMFGLDLKMPITVSVL